MELSSDVLIYPGLPRLIRLGAALLVVGNSLIFLCFKCICKTVRYLSLYTIVVVPKLMSEIS